MNKYFMSLLLVTTGSMNSIAQKHPDPIEIGQSLPTIEYKTQSRDVFMNTLQWRGKYTLIDFWGVNCHSCIEEMPKLELLQQKFRDDLQILLVTKNTDAQVNKVFQIVKINRPQLSFVNNDSTFNSFFPHSIIPHCVIIDKKGMLLYITHDYIINEKNLFAIINGDRPHLPLKEDLLDFDKMQSLLSEGKGRLIKNIKWYSVLMDAVDGFSGYSVQFLKDTVKKTGGFKFINAPISELLKFSIGKGNSPDFVYSNRIIIESADSSRFIRPTDPLIIDAWQACNTFCYEFRVPYHQYGEVYLKMARDLENYFPYKAVVERRKTKCWKLIKAEKSIIARDNQPTIKSFAVAEVVAKLNKKFSATTFPILTALDKNDRLLMDPVLFEETLQQIQLKLLNYGYQLIEVEEMLDMLVIKDLKEKDIASW